MAELVIANKQDIVSIANEIRTLSGTTEGLGLNDMTTNVSNANDVVDTQADLIAQIATALEGKASGGSGGTSVETCIVEIESVGMEGYAGCNVHYCQNNDYKKLFNSDESFEINVDKNSILVIESDNAGGIVNANKIAYDGTVHAFLILDDACIQVN